MIKDRDELLRLQLNMARANLNLIAFYFRRSVEDRPLFEPEIVKLVAEWQGIVDDATCRLIDAAEDKTA